MRDDCGPAADTQHYTAGANVLGDQAQCPFRAFVKHRLKADTPEEPMPGSDLRDRGTVIHLCLQTLLAPDFASEGLDGLGEAEIDAAVEAALAQQGGVLNREIEHGRIKALIGEWLQQEKQRQPFTIIATEQLTEATLAELKLRLRIDRIDRLSNGDLCIIDYKNRQRQPRRLGGRATECTAAAVICRGAGSGSGSGGVCRGARRGVCLCRHRC